MLCDKNTSENRIFKGKDILENNPFVFQVRKHRAGENAMSCLKSYSYSWQSLAQVSPLKDQYLIVMNNCDFLSHIFPYIE